MTHLVLDELEKNRAEFAEQLKQLRATEKSIVLAMSNIDAEIVRRRPPVLPTKKDEMFSKTKNKRS